MPKTRFLIFLISLFFVFLFSPAQAHTTSLSVQEAQEMIQAHAGDPQFILLDVRAPELYEQGHIPGARLINYYATNFVRQVSQLDREATILLYCHHGRQSPLALRAMKKLRFKELYILDGGFTAWAEAGLPVEP
ncbi:MAG: rhodanese-like domain-containing protein [Desulfomicrobium sp.]|nr:rhodanese-like domain-containing protein [Desulfomicrobium sp.]